MQDGGSMCDENALDNRQDKAKKNIIRRPLLRFIIDNLYFYFIGCRDNPTSREKEQCL